MSSSSPEKVLDRPPRWVAWSAAVVRALPFGRYRAAGTLGRLSRRPFRARLPEALGGSAFLCDLRDGLAREVCFTGRYEPQETHIMRRILCPGMTVVDVGANWGYHTLVAAHLIGPSGRVLALEPHPRLHALLSDNVAANELTHVTCVRLAAGATTSTASFVDFSERGGNWGLSRAPMPGERGDFTCAAAPLDAVLGRHRVRAVDLVKIDVEGAEDDLLVGMGDGLAGHRYRHVLIECHPAALRAKGVGLECCLAPLVENGYRGWQIDHSSAMHRRAALSEPSLDELLRPLDIDTTAADPWPHFLFAAPGAAALA